MDNIKEVTPEEVEEIIENSKDTIVIDVREDEEVETGMIEVAKHIPMKQIPQEAVNLDKKKDYILVCRSGARSMNVALYMKEQGFNVSNMVGGMLDWTGEVITK